MRRVAIIQSFRSTNVPAWIEHPVVVTLMLLAGLCALVSSSFVTPRIHALREAGQTQIPEFGRLHAISTGLVGIEILLYLVALWVAPAPAKG